MPDHRLVTEAEGREKLLAAALTVCLMERDAKAVMVGIDGIHVLFNVDDNGLRMTSIECDDPMQAAMLLRMEENGPPSPKVIN